MIRAAKLDGSAPDQNRRWLEEKIEGSMDYRVEWIIDIFDVASPKEAARKAREYQTTPGTTATVFDVYGDERNGESIRVDLMELDEEP